MSKDIDKEIKALERSLAETNKRLEELKKKAAVDDKKTRFKLISDHAYNGKRYFSAVATGYSHDHGKIIKKFFIDQSPNGYWDNPLEGYVNDIDDLIGIPVDANSYGASDILYMGEELTGYGKWLRNQPTR